VKFLGIDPEAVHIIPNGVGPAFFEPYDKERSKELIAKKYGVRKLILYVSRIEPRKNHDSLLNAYLELELYRKGYSLVFLGHQTIRSPRLERILDGLPEDIRKFIRIIGKVDDAGLLDFYRAADAFVYPSKAEGFGIPPLEAAALKVPVICSNSSAMEGYSFFEEYHINPVDPGLLRSKLSAIIDDPPGEGWLSGLSTRIRREYSWELGAERLYKAVLADNLLSLGDPKAIRK
jgi:glycosyltransferase involved in cell wall biosynthesis